MNDRRVDIFCKAGASLLLDITWTGDEGPLGLEGAWVAATFRPEYGKPELFTVSSDDAEISFGYETGQIFIRIPPEKTLLLNPDGSRPTKGVFDVKCVLGTLETDYPIWDGRWTCDPRSTEVNPDAP